MAITLARPPERDLKAEQADSSSTATSLLARLSQTCRSSVNVVVFAGLQQYRSDAHLRLLLKCFLQVKAIQRSGLPGVCLPFLIEKSADLDLFYRVYREVFPTASPHAKCLKAAYRTFDLCGRHSGLRLWPAQQNPKREFLLRATLDRQTANPGATSLGRPET